VGRILPRLITDARTAARSADGPDRRRANAVLADVYALTQHEVVWASEAELVWTVADRAMSAAQEADTPVALAGAAWTLGMVQRSAGDTDGALSLARDAAELVEPMMDGGSDELRALAGALELHAATTCAKAGREGDAWRYWDRANVIAQRLPDRYHHPWTMFGSSNVDLHAVSISADLAKSQEARSHAEQIDPEESRARNAVEGWVSRSPAPTVSGRITQACCTGWNSPTRPRRTRCSTHPRRARRHQKPSITVAR
jgi:hypothetical protein